MTNKKIIMFTALTSISFLQLQADDRIEQLQEPQPPIERGNIADEEEADASIQFAVEHNMSDDEKGNAIHFAFDKTERNEEEDDASIQFAVEHNMSDDEKGNAIHFAFDKTERNEEEDRTGSAFDQMESEDEKGTGIRFVFDKTDRVIDGDEEEGKNSYSC